jgi:hypothetical protein
MVDDDLAEGFTPGMTAEALFAAYRMFGRDPVILGGDGAPFSAWAYARERATAMVNTAAKSAGQAAP